MNDTTINVRLSGRFGEFEASMSIPEVYFQCFENVASGDIPLVSALLGDIARDSASFKRKMKVREDAAADIASVISKFLVAAMKNKDTHNGYPVERRDR